MDQFYYESGYIDASYFVYTADAESAITTQATMTVAVGVIKDSSITLTVTSSVQATISHIEGADLFAFTEAALSAQVDRIRDNNIEASAVFDVAADAVRGIYVSAQADSAFDLSADNLRIRFSEAAVDAAFSLTADAEMIDGGIIVQASGSWTSEIYLACNTERIYQLSSDFGSAFTPTVDCNITVNTFAVLDSTTELTADADVITDVTASFELQATANALAEQTISLSSELTTSFNQNSDVRRLAGLDSSLTATSNLSCTISHIEGADIQAFTDAELTASANRIRSMPITFTGIFDITAQPNQSANTSANISSQFAVATQGQRQFNYWINETSYPEYRVYSRGVAVDSQENIYQFLYGYDNSIGSGDQDVVLVKKDKRGVQLWAKAISDSDTTFPTAIKVGGTDHIYVAFNRDTTNPSDPAYIAKYNASGVLQWQKQIVSTAGSIISDIATDSSGNLYVTSKIDVTVDTCRLTKFNSSGTYQWAKTVSNCFGTELAITSTGQPVVVFKVSGSDRLHILNASDGSNVRVQFVGDVESIALDSSNNIYITKLVAVYDPTLRYITHIDKIDSSGNAIWRKVYDGYSTDYPSVYNGVLYLKLQDPGRLMAIDTSTGNPIWQYQIAKGSELVYISGSAVNSQGLFLSAYVVDGDLYNGVLFKLPLDGSGTPVSDYQFTPTTIDLTDGTPSASNTTATLTASTNYFTTSSLTDSDVAFYADFINIYGTEKAALSSTATVSVLGSKLIEASAGLASTSSINCQPVKVKQLSSSIASQGFLVASFGRIRPFVDLEVSSSSLTASATVLVEFSSSLTSQSNITASADKQLGAITADLSSTSSTTVTTELFAEGLVNLNVSSAQVTAFGLIKPAVSLGAGQFTLQVNSEISVEASANISSSATLSADAEKQLGPVVANLQVTAFELVAAVALPSGSVNMSATTSMSVTGLRIKQLDIATESTTNLSASVITVTNAVSAISSTSDLSATGLRIQPGQANLEVSGSELVAVSKVGSALVDASVVSALTVNTIKNATVETTLESTTDLNSSVSAIKPFEVNINAMASTMVIATGGLIAGGSITVTSTMAAQAVKTSSARSTIQSQATLTSNLTAIRKGIVLEVSQASMTTNARVLRGLTLQAQAQTQLTAVNRKIGSLSAQLQAQGFVLAVGKVIDLSVSETWVVSPDNNAWIVPTDINIYIVEQENRNFLIEG